MGDFVKGISTLLTGGAPKKGPGANFQSDITAQREAERLAAAKQKEQLDQQEAEQDLRAGRATPVPRGRRLLLAATGEQGVAKSTTLG